jgi:hypothetical protein
MKIPNKLFRNSFVIIAFFALFSCEKKEDYSHIVYKNYLTYEIRRATSFLDSAVEGTAEGEYKTGSKQAYYTVIDAARLVDEKSFVTQEEVDQAYQSLLQADSVFFDQMVPFRSAFQEIIDYGDVVLAITEEGNQEGNVNPGNKAILQAALDQANQLISTSNLTQRMLDKGTNDLQDAIYSFNGEIIGNANTAVINSGFEQPGYGTEDFLEVNGWSLFRNAEPWAPKAAVTEIEEAPEGSFVAKIGSYTQGLYQPVEEMINPNARYTLEFDVILLSNEPDWEGGIFPAVMHSRIIVFEKEAGNYNYIAVLSESYDTLGIEPGGVIRLSQAVTIDAISPYVGKKVAIDFEQRHTWDPENPIWAESFVAVDRVRLLRKKL